MRLYIIPSTKGGRGVVDFLRLYGLPTVIETDNDGAYIDLTLPDYWSEVRQRTFNEAIARMNVTLR
jgi:hypothetical protein